MRVCYVYLVTAYDDWKTATPPEYEHTACTQCGRYRAEVLDLCRDCDRDLREPEDGGCDDDLE